MRDLDPAQPQFFALDQAVDVETLADADRRRRWTKILDISHFRQMFIACDHRYASARSLEDLCIIARVGLALPRAMCFKDRGLSKRLPGLDPAQQREIGRAQVCT